jgi:DNA-binding LacI/PurR family transcriptional regulator
MADKRVTLNDVAAASGVSRATASFVLNDAPNQSISLATQERVRRAAQDLGYVPHGIARALREGSSRIVVLTIDHDLEVNYTRSFIRGLDAELDIHQHVLLVQYVHEIDESDRRAIEALMPRAVLAFAQAYLTPGHELDDGGWDNGGMANNVFIQIGHLADRGHRTIAVVAPAEGDPLGQVRLAFAREAAQRLALAQPEVLLLPSDRSAARAALRTFRDMHADVTAFAGYSDDVALRLLAAASDLGLRVPGDIAVIGFDESEFGGLATPALTTVHIDAQEHGRLAARLALGLDPSGITRYPGRLVVRDST